MYKKLRRFIILLTSFFTASAAGTVLHYIKTTEEDQAPEYIKSAYEHNQSKNGRS
jgi:hypothetical protein